MSLDSYGLLLFYPSTRHQDVPNLTRLVPRSPMSYPFAGHHDDPDPLSGHQDVADLTELATRHVLQTCSGDMVPATCSVRR